MLTVEDTICISLNSQHGKSLASNGDYVKSYLSHMTYEFTGLLKEEDDILSAHITVQDAQIGVSFYNINYSNNTLKYTIDNSIIKSLIIPVGNYNIQSLKNEMKKQFFIAGYTLVITFSETTNKYTFIHDTLEFSFLSSGSTLLESIGFDSVVSYVSSNKILYSEHCVSLLGIKKLVISSSALRTSSVASGKGGDILAVIPVNGGPRQIILYNNTSNSKSLLRNKTIDNIDIIIRSEDQNYVNFNNVEYSMTLSLIITRILKTNTTLPLFSNNGVSRNDTAGDASATLDEPTQPFGDESDLDFYMYKKGFSI
jgi:hypothetical protein